jgi:putative ABC transport system permease protein
VSWWSLLRAGLWRRPIRTVLTAASLAMAFLLIGLLSPFLSAFTNRADLTGVDRLVVQPRHSITDFLPVSHEPAIRTLPGVRATSHQTWFGGNFRDDAESFPRWAVPPDTYLAMRPEIVLEDDQRQAFLESRTGAILGRATATRYGLRVGDRLALLPDIWSNKDARAWEFEVVGIFDSADRTVDLTALYFSYAFFDEYRAWGAGLVSYLLVALDPSAAPADVAAAIDQRFANSADETHSSSEQDYALGFADQLGDVRLMLSIILGSVLFTMALVSANTLSQGMRERTAEFAVLRALGFRPGLLKRLIVGEALLLVWLGAAPGLLGAVLVLETGPSLFGGISLSAGTLASATVAAVALAVLAALQPIWRLHRLRVADALRDA